MGQKLNDAEDRRRAEAEARREAEERIDAEQPLPQSGHDVAAAPTYVPPAIVGGFAVGLSGRGGRGRGRGAGGRGRGAVTA